MTTTYTPEWAREHNPTEGMTHAEMTAYYKQHSLLGDVLFALRPGTETPIVIVNGWLAILSALNKRQGKATPALRAEGKRLRNLTREWLATQPRDARFEMVDDGEAA